MKEILYEFVVDMFRQVFGMQKPREGKLSLTRLAHKRMSEYQLNISILEDVFRNGEEVKDKMIVRKYKYCSVGIVYTANDVQPLGKPDARFLIVTCWKRSNW